MKALKVFYDPQEGSYFKVDKDTGETLRVHRNGSDLARFKPEYTGADYKIRKVTILIFISNTKRS